MSRSKENTTNSLEIPNLSRRRSETCGQHLPDQTMPGQSCQPHCFTSGPFSPPSRLYRSSSTPANFLWLISNRAVILRITAIVIAIHQSSTDLPPMLSRLRIMANQLRHRLLPLTFAGLLRSQRKSLISQVRRAREKDCRRPLWRSVSGHRRSIPMRSAPWWF
jgi:hypothetical protein